MLSRRKLLKNAASAAAAGAALPAAAACTMGGRGGERPAAVLPESPVAAPVSAPVSPPVPVRGPAAPLVLRPSLARGHANHGWLDTRHTFSFASYYDPRHMGFRGLRVINEDHIAGAGGFPMHPHRDMEIVTYVLTGALEHKDSLGNGGVIRPGEVQRMSAGSGIRHSEFNPSKRDDVHLLQIWIEPDVRGVAPGYAQTVFPAPDRTGRLRLVASPDGRDGSLSIRTDTNLYASILEPGTALAFGNRAGRHAWLQVARGRLRVNGQTLVAGDGAAVSAAGSLELEALDPSEILLFDLA